jgi:hypothetical protein
MRTPFAKTPFYATRFYKESASKKSPKAAGVVMVNNTMVSVSTIENNNFEARRQDTEF